MNTTQIDEQDKIQLGEINKEEQEPRSSLKCKVEVQHFKYKLKPHRYIKKVVKLKKVKKIKTPEIIRERNRECAKKCRYRKRFLKERNNPKPKPLTTAQRSKRYRDKKKNLKNSYDNEPPAHC